VVPTATEVIDKFGGQSALARLIDKRPSTVQHWAKQGTIPVKWHAPLLRLAAERNIDLRPSDLVPQPEPVVLNRLPRALWWGDLMLGDEAASCFVLDDGRRVISRTGATDVLTGRKGGGNLESYIQVESLAGYLPPDLDDQWIDFEIPEVTNKRTRGISAETFLDLCTAYVRARDDGARLTPRQGEIAVKAGMVLAASAKVGLIALIDEATGYQYERAQDALQMKLRLYLEEEMRQWEKTFPDELWQQFARLTHREGEGAITKRPKYWGKLVMELIYGYLDPDVAEWLRKNAPAPRHGQNYHQWLSSQYGLRRLMEHMWKVIGMAQACDSMRELRERMAETYGRQPYQFTLFLEAPYRKLPPADQLPPSK
jgi:hypothetical protein